MGGGSPLGNWGEVLGKGLGWYVRATLLTTGSPGMSLALEPSRAQSASGDDKLSFILLWALSLLGAGTEPHRRQGLSQLPPPSALHRLILLWGLGLKTQVQMQPKPTFLLFWIFLFFILSFDSLGFFEVGRVLATAFSLFLRVRELFLTGDSFVRGTDWEAMGNTGERADYLYLRVCAQGFPVCPRDTEGRGDREERKETQTP